MSLLHASDKFHFVINSIKSPNSLLRNLGLFSVELLISLISRDLMIDVRSTSINTYNFLLYNVKSMIPLIIKINSLYNNIVYLMRNLLYHRQSTLLLLHR